MIIEWKFRTSSLDAPHPEKLTIEEMKKLQLPIENITTTFTFWAKALRQDVSTGAFAWNVEFEVLVIFFSGS